MIHIKQVCVQLPAVAVNVTLLTFAPERHAVAAPLLPAKWPATNPLHTAAVVARWERQTDTGPLHRPCYAYYASSINNYAEL